jgi:hypothetical protein
VLHLINPEQLSGYSFNVLAILRPLEKLAAKTTSRDRTQKDHPQVRKELFGSLGVISFHSYEVLDGNQKRR